MKLLKRWSITTIVTFAFFIVPISAFLACQDLSLCRGNPHMDLWGNLICSMRQGLVFSAVAAFTAGQGIFWISELLRRAGIINIDTEKKRQFVTIPLITIGITAVIIIITMPFWFRITI